MCTVLMMGKDCTYEDTERDCIAWAFLGLPFEGLDFVTYTLYLGGGGISRDAAVACNATSDSLVIYSMDRLPLWYQVNYVISLCDVNRGHPPVADCSQPGCSHLLISDCSDPYSFESHHF